MDGVIRSDFRRFAAVDVRTRTFAVRVCTTTASATQRPFVDRGLASCLRRGSGIGRGSSNPSSTDFRAEYAAAAFRSCFSSRQRKKNTRRIFIRYLQITEAVDLRVACDQSARSHSLVAARRCSSASRDRRVSVPSSVPSRMTFVGTRAAAGVRPRRRSATAFRKYFPFRRERGIRDCRAPHCFRSVGDVCMESLRVTIEAL